MKKILLFLVLFFSFLQISYADDISDASIDSSVVHNVWTTWGFAVSEDWTQFYYLSSPNLVVYNLTTPYDVTTKVFAYNKDISWWFWTGNFNDLEFSEDGMYLYISSAGSTWQLKGFSMSVAFDPASIVQNMWSRYMWSNQVSWIEIANNWYKFYVYTTVDLVEEYNLTTPYDINTRVLVNSKNTSSLCPSASWGLAFSNDGQYAYRILTNGICQMKMTTPYDITTLITYDSFLWTGYTERYYSAIDLVQEDYRVFIWIRGDGIVWLTQSTMPGPGPLETVYVWGQTDTEDGVDFLFECNADCIINYSIDYDYDEFLEPQSTYNWTLGSFSGSTELFTGTILNNPPSFSFELYQDYWIEFEFIEVADPLNKLYLETGVHYDYLGIEVEITEESFVFSVDSVDFLPNGFNVTNFTAEPKGWNLWFYITGPNESWTGTQVINAGPYFHKSYDPLTWYWTDTILDVSNPYHEYAGNYNMYFVYNYLDFQLYPFWTGAVNYFISEPELFIDNAYIWQINYDNSVFTLDVNGDGEVWILDGEFLIWITNIIKYFFAKLFWFFENIKALVEKLSNIFTVEVKTFSFIPSANASELSDALNWVDKEAFKWTTLWKIDTFIKWFVTFFVFIIWLVVFIWLNKRKND